MVIVAAVSSSASLSKGDTLQMGGTNGSISISVGGYLANPSQFYTDNGIADPSYYSPPDLLQTTVNPAILNGHKTNLFCVDLLTAVGAGKGTVYGLTQVTMDGTVSSLNNGVLGSTDFGIPNPYGSSTGLVGAFPGAAPNAANAIAWMVDNQAPANLTLDARMGLQAAIWKVEYGNDFDITSSATSAAVAAFYKADLIAVGYSHDPNQSDYTGYSLNGPLLSAPLASAHWISPGEAIYDGIAVDQFGNPMQAFVAPVTPRVPAPSSLTMLAGFMASAIAIVVGFRRQMQDFWKDG